MSKIIVAYWSQTGNTEAMANAVGEGIKAAGGEADVVPVSAVSVDELKAASSFALGCPAMGAEVLEESDGAFRRRGRRLCSRQKDRFIRFLRMG